MRISDWSSDVCSSDLDFNSLKPNHKGLLGWGGRLRTCEWRHQKPLSHHLATFPTFTRPAEICGFFDFSQSGRGGKPKIRQKSRQILGERSEEQTPELQQLMRISTAFFCLRQKKQTTQPTH